MIRPTCSSTLTIAVIALLAAASSSAPTSAQSGCWLPDNGGGTVDLPLDCPDGYTGSLELLEGLPPGSTIQMNARLADFILQSSSGTPATGTVETFTATVHLDVQGTGTLSGFHRTLSVPVVGETRSDPRAPGSPVQAFDFTMHRLQGILRDDYDFRLLWFEGGNVYGLPSHGETTLERLGPPGNDFAVSSAFDFNYRIQFEGNQGSKMLSGWRGITLDLQSDYSLGGLVSVPVGAGSALELTAFPNPVRSSARVRFSVPSERHVILAIYDVHGRHVRTLFRGSAIGRHEVWWDGTDARDTKVLAGLYFARLEAGPVSRTARVVVTN